VKPGPVLEQMAVAFWLLASAGACTGWQEVDVSPEQFIAEQHPGAIRVTRRDQGRVELDRPWTVGDTLFGTMEHAAAPTQFQFGLTSTPLAAGDSVTEARIPFADAVRVEQRHVSAGKTAGMVAGILAVGAMVAGLVVVGNNVGSGPILHGDF